MIENLIVLDIDDTLTKSEFQHQASFVETMRHFGITNINENWSGYEHITDSYILKENYEQNFNKPFDFSLVASFEEFMSQRMLEFSPCQEVVGAKNLIETLKRHKNYAFCCATGSFSMPALLKLKQAELSCPEELVVGSNELMTREQIVNRAISKAKKYYQVNEFEHIISIGDGLWDLKTATNIGIHFVGIGNKNKSDFTRENILCHIHDWSEFSLNQLEQKLR